MANEQNLKTLTPNEARELGRIGGIASGKVRREHKKLRDIILALSDTPIEMHTGQPISKDNWFEKFGIDNPTIMNVILARLLNSACNGDLRAIKIVLDVIGDIKPEQDVATIIGTITKQQITVSYKINKTEMPPKHI